MSEELWKGIGYTVLLGMVLLVSTGLHLASQHVEPKEVPRPINHYLLNLEYQQVTKYIESEARFLSYAPSDYMQNYAAHKEKYLKVILENDWTMLLLTHNTTQEKDPIEIFMIELEYVMIKFLHARSKAHEEGEDYEAVPNG